MLEHLLALHVTSNMRLPIVRRPPYVRQWRFRLVFARACRTFASTTIRWPVLDHDCHAIYPKMLIDIVISYISTST